MPESQKKVLIVEDEKAYARALSLKLEHVGLIVEYAADGEEALSYLKKNSYDLIILDLVMPKLNGFGVLEEMKRLSIKTPVIVLSNLTQEEDKKKAEGLGVVQFIEKSNTTIIDAINIVANLLKLSK